MAILAVIVTLIVFLTAAYSLNNKIWTVGKTLGDTQYKLLNTYDNAEKINFYIDEAARMSGYKTASYLSDNGGANVEDCGQYFGATLLTNQEKNCIPEDNDISPNFKEQFNLIFNGYISQYSTYKISNQFEYYIVEDIIRGIANDKVVLPIDGEKVENYKKQEEMLVDNSQASLSPKSGQKLVELALTQQNKIYCISEGSRVCGKPAISNKNPTDFDCSGFTSWTTGQLGVSLKGGSTEQYSYMEKNNAFISLEKAYNTPGAWLYRPPGYNGQKYGHVAISVGDGKNTIEAMGTQYGVKKGGLFLANGKPRFTHAALVPGIDYNVVKLSNTQTTTNESTIQTSGSKTALIGEYLDTSALSKVVSGKTFDYYPESGKTSDYISSDYNNNIRGKGYEEIIVVAGLNDLISGKDTTGIETSLQFIYSSAKASNIKVIALTLPPNEKYSSKIKEVNDWIKTKPEGIYAVVDINSSLSDGIKLKSDYGSESPYSINSKGKEIIAKAVYDNAYKIQPNQNSGTRKIAIIGDSITADNIYVNELKKLINNNQNVFDVYAVAGKPTSWMLDQYNSNVKGKDYTDLIILGGINNIDGSPQNDLEKIYSDAKSQKIRVIALKLTPVTPTQYKIDYSKIKKVNDWIDSQKGKNVDIIIDTFSLLADANNQLKKEYDSGDGLHPNEAGKKLIAKAVYDNAFSGSTQQGSGTTCAGINSEQLKQNLANTKYKSCVPYIDFIKKYKEKNDMDYNIVLLTSVVYGESNCIEVGPTKNGFGLMQVTGKWKDKYPNYNGNPEQQIEAGVGILKYYSDSTKKLNINELTRMKVALYGYNRGNNADVVNLMKNNPNLDLKTAMIQACQKVYVDECCGLSNKHCKYICNKDGSFGANMCTGSGLGSNYADKILKEYDNICKAAGGTIEEGISQPISQVAETYNSIGEYSFTPAFEENFGFDLEIYTKIYKTLKTLNEMHDASSEPNNFTTNILEYAKKVEPSLDWTNDIDSPDKKFFYSFAEQYSQCSDSVDNDCYCEIKFRNDFEEKNILGMRYDGKNTYITNGEDSEIIFSKNLMFFPGFLFNPNQQKDSLSLTLEKIDENKYSLKVSPSEGVFSNIDYSNMEFSKPFYVKKIKTSMGFLKNDEYNKILNNNNKKICSIKKEAFRLGVKTNFSIPVEYSDKTIIRENQTIKFAYYFRDMIPPPFVYDLVKIDQKFNDKGIILRWKHDDVDQDTSKFVVFYSKDNINRYTFKALEEMSNSNSVEKKEFLVGDIESFQSIDFENPNIDFSDYIKTNYNAIKEDGNPLKITLSNDVLYYLSKNYEDYDEYVLKISAKENGNYDFVVASVDKYGNAKLIDEYNYESPNIVIDVKDTLPPATYPLSDFYFSASKNENPLLLAWNMPTKNIDGSKFDFDKELSGYYIYYGETLNADNILSSNKKSMPKDKNNNQDDLITFDPTKGICYYVVPYDINGNSQFSEDTKELMKDSRFFSPKCIDPIR